MHRLNRATNVRADEMLSAYQIRRPALFVIRHGQTQGRHPQPVEDTAGLDVAIRLGIPLGYDNDGGARFALAFTASRKQTRARNVIFRRRRLESTAPGQEITR